MTLPSIWFFDSVRVNDQATIVRYHNTRDAYDARGCIDRNKSDTGYDGLIVFIRAKARPRPSTTPLALCEGKGVNPNSPFPERPPEQRGSADQANSEA